MYVEDHENGWTIWASVQFGLSVLTIAYYIMLLIMRYVLGVRDIFSNYIYQIVFAAVNTLNLLVPLSKYAFIYYESDLEWGDCGLFNCFWALNSYVGEVNLDVEMYPDIFKTAALVLNYAIYMMFPWVDDWVAGKLLFDV